MPQGLVGGRYSMVRQVAEGGMATVWKAEALGAGAFRMPVAIKVLKPDFRVSDEFGEMFLEEARIGATLHHPHIVEVIDFFTHDGNQHLVLEWIDGVSLLEVLQYHAKKDEVIPWPFVAHVGIGALRGLTAAHRRRLDNGTIAPVVHRDVSPANILLGRSGAVKLADFGVARARDRVAKATQPGVVKGKLSYLAPEIAKGGIASPQSDVFSLGCSLWEMLACKKLFDGATDLDVILKIAKGQAPSIGTLRPTLPARLISTIDRSLQSNTNDRFRSTSEMIDQLNLVLREDGSNQDAYDCVAEVVGRIVGKPSEIEMLDLDAQTVRV